jgi:D-alanine-D-alanine ligase
MKNGKASGGNAGGVSANGAGGRPSVLVLGGGPDAEREVSLNSARAVAAALKQTGRYTVVEQTIDRPGLSELHSWKGEVIFPVLHGPFGEGGPMQDLLEMDGRSYVGCRPRAARLAMDKATTKMIAIGLGIPTAEACIFNVTDESCPVPTPLVIKPVHDGSSCGLHVCKDAAAWQTARAKVAVDIKKNPGRAYMVERYVPGRELTVGILDGRALPTIEIRAASGLYDYEAKYTRDDTRYQVGPELPPGVGQAVEQAACALSAAVGVRHLARVDFIVDGRGTPWLLEINTMPGFTDHSLVPMAARAVGLEMPALCAGLVEMALRETVIAAQPLSAAGAAR